MKAKPAASLIIAVYNWPEALELCLNSVLLQTQMPGEVIIADDGSGRATAAIVEKFRPLIPVPLTHVWQADDGFRLARIRNKAVAASACAYIIQIDGDLVLHPSFIKDHTDVATEGHFVCGSRVIMNQGLSAKLLSARGTRVSLLQHGLKNRLNGLHAPWLNRLIGKAVNKQESKSIRGCNMAYWRNNFIQVNGYNEAFEGWGREDTDLVLRFYKFGLQRTFFKFRGIVFHIYHKEADRSRLEVNDRLLQTAGTDYYCSDGISKYLSRLTGDMQIIS